MAGISLYLAFYFDGPVLLKKTFAYLSNNRTGHAPETPLACAKEIFAWPPITSVAITRTRPSRLPSGNLEGLQTLNHCFGKSLGPQGTLH